MKHLPRVILFLVAIAFALSLLTGLTTVETGEMGVVTRFGRIIDTREPGLYVGLPWGIDRVYRVKVDEYRKVPIGFAPADEETEALTTPQGQLLTGDHNLVNIQALIFYAVQRDSDGVQRFVFQQDRARDLVARTAETVLAEWVAGRKYDTVFAKGKLTQTRSGEPTLSELLVAETQKRLEEYKLGVVLQEARVTYLNPPREVKDAYDAVTSAETQIKTAIYKAEQARADLLQTKKGEAYRRLSLAQSYADEQVQLAKADAENFEKQLQQYRSLSKVNPYYLNAIWWDAMSQLYSKMRNNGRIDVLDHHLSNGGLDITTMPALPKKR